MHTRSLVLASAVLLLLAACGGGGGGGSAAIELTPRSWTSAFQQGDSDELVVTARLSRAIDVAGYLRIVDTGGVIASPIALMPGADQRTYTAKLIATYGLDAGRYSGQLLIDYCEDGSCSSVLASGTFPYELTVLSNTNLTPLRPLPGAADWRTRQGDPAHTGFVPVTLDPTKFSSRWLNAFPSVYGEGETHEVTTSRSLAYVLSRTSTFRQYTLDAFHESDGSLTWSTLLPGEYDLVTQPVLASDVSDAPMVYIVGYVSNPIGKGTLLAFDALTGTRIFSVELPDLAITAGAAGAPVVVGDRLFTHGGSVQDSGDQIGLLCLDANTGSLVWRQTIGAYIGSSPAIGDAGVFSPGVLDRETQTYGLALLRPSDGAVIAQVADERAGAFDAFVSLADSAGTSAILNYEGGIVRADAMSPTPEWAVPGLFFAGAAIDGDKVYAFERDPLRLSVLDLATGAAAWAWTPPETDTAFYGRPVVTNNLVFVSTNRKVYALNKATRSVVWSYSSPGTLSISANGLLYITRMYPGGLPSVLYGAPEFTTGVFAAINLH